MQPPARSVVSVDLTSTHSKRANRDSKSATSNKLAIMMKFHPKKKISKSPCQGNLNPISQYSGEWVSNTRVGAMQRLNTHCLSSFQ